MNKYKVIQFIFEECVNVLEELSKYTDDELVGICGNQLIKFNVNAYHRVRLLFNTKKRKNASLTQREHLICIGRFYESKIDKIYFAVKSYE